MNKPAVSAQRATLNSLTFPDGGSYVGAIEEGRSQGLGLCLGPRRQGEFAGVWQNGFETLGVYSGSALSGGSQYEGQWAQGRRDGLGVDRRGGWVYRGEWSQGFRGRYGVRQSLVSEARFEGTWTTGLPDGYGVETYGDRSTYSGQWLRGLRHGYGVRQSAPYPLAALHRPVSSRRQRADDIRSLTDAIFSRRDRRVESTRGGFVLQAEPAPPPRRRGLLLDRHGRPSLGKTLAWQFRRQGSVPGAGGDPRGAPSRPLDGRRSGSVRSAIVGPSYGNSFVEEDEEICEAWSFVSLVELTQQQTAGLVETYRGEWKDDRRSGYGACTRSDGLRYEGEWLHNRKHGYGATTLPDGRRLEGKYKNNVLVMAAGSSRGLQGLLRSSKVSDHVAFAVEEARRAADSAGQKVEIAMARMESARQRASEADTVALRAATEAEAARAQAAHTAARTQPESDFSIIVNRLSERDFLTEHSPHDTDLPVNQFGTKKKRFSLFGRKRSNSVTSPSYFDVMAEADVAGHQRNQFGAPPRPVHSTEASLSYALHPQSAAGQGAVQGAGAPRYTFERHPQSAVNRLSSVPSYTHADQYDPGGGPPPGALPRRKSLPSIVKQSLPAYPAVQGQQETRARQGVAAVPSSAQPAQRTQTYIIERGVHKLVRSSYEEPTRGGPQGGGGATEAGGGGGGDGGALSRLIKSSFQAASAATRSRPFREEQFDKLYKTESPRLQRKAGLHGSTPDVSTGKSMAVLPREAVYVMSQRRREELIQERADNERRSKGHVIITLNGPANWFGEHSLLVSFLLINILLATIFFNFL